MEGSSRVIFRKEGDVATTKRAGYQFAEDCDEDCERLLAAAATLAVSELPRLLGRLREVEATAMMRLATPPPNGHATAEHDSLLDIEHDVMLDSKQAARRLGVGVQYLYDHWKELPFARKYKYILRFSARGIEEYGYRKANGEHNVIGVGPADSRAGEAGEPRIRSADGCSV